MTDEIVTVSGNLCHSIQPEIMGGCFKFDKSFLFDLGMTISEPTTTTTTSNAKSNTNTKNCFFM